MDAKASADVALDAMAWEYPGAGVRSRGYGVRSQDRSRASDRSGSDPVRRRFDLVASTEGTSGAPQRPPRTGRGLGLVSWIRRHDHIVPAGACLVLAEIGMVVARWVF